jgi:hypothetical protein
LLQVGALLGGANSGLFKKTSGRSWDGQVGAIRCWAERRQTALFEGGDGGEDSIRELSGRVGESVNMRRAVVETQGRWQSGRIPCAEVQPCGVGHGDLLSWSGERLGPSKSDGALGRKSKMNSRCRNVLSGRRGSTCRNKKRAEWRGGEVDGGHDRDVARRRR